MNPDLRKCRTRSLGWVFVSRMIGIICLLIVFVLAKILENFTSKEGIYHGAIEGLLFANFWLLIVIAVIILVADIFIALPFPLNLPGPVIRAIGSVFCIALVLNVFQWIDSTAGTNIYQIFWLLSFLVVPLVFIVVLVSGYFEIVKQLFRQARQAPADDQVTVSPDHPRAVDQPLSDAKSWEEIGEEFRMVIYDLLHRFRQEVKRK
ncbi:MAG TPA: hypothetical protein VMT44_02875 [Methanoregula sp.]|nr:hypothetical protein [Methanoregula sp.]